MEVATTVIEPEILSSELKEITQLISHFETTMKRDENREYKHPAGLLAHQRHGDHAGEEFSFNKDQQGRGPKRPDSGSPASYYTDCPTRAWRAEPVRCRARSSTRWSWRIWRLPSAIIIPMN